MQSELIHTRRAARVLEEEIGNARKRGPTFQGGFKHGGRDGKSNVYVIT